MLRTKATGGMSISTAILSLRSHILGSGNEEGRTIRGIMHIHCKNWVNIILGDLGKGSGGQVNHGLGLRTTI